MQSETTMRNCYEPIRIGKIIKIANTRYWQGCVWSNWWSNALWVGMLNGMATLENNMVVP